MGNANCISSSINHYSSIINTAKCNMTVFMVNHVIKVSDNSKKCFNVNKSDELWLIDSGASHHITNELSDYTSYKPYETPDPIQTANVHDSLMVHGEGTVFFDTKTTNGQIHKVHLDNIWHAIVIILISCQVISYTISLVIMGDIIGDARQFHR